MFYISGPQLKHFPFRLTNARLEDAGEYECHGENIAGRNTLTAVIEVQQPPIITLTPDSDSITAIVGENINIECHATGIPQPTVYWKLPSDEIALASSPRTSTGHASLNIYHIKPNEAGRYICEANSPAGTDVKYFDIQVTAGRGDTPPDVSENEGFTPGTGNQGRDDRNRDRDGNRDHGRNRDRNGNRDQDRNRDREYDRTHHPHNPQPTRFPPYKIHLNEQSLLSCQITGIDKPTTWRRSDGKHLPRGARIEGTELIIEMTQFDATGTYDCIVDDGIQEPFTIAIAEIIVVDAPRISFSPVMPMRVRSGESVDVFCNATGEQPLYVNWHMENNGPLPNTVRVSGKYLQFNHITQYDTGRYYCSARNVHGNVTKVAEVFVTSEFWFLVFFSGFGE